MDLQEINAVIFDFGGVLINIQYEATIEAFKELGIDEFDTLFSQAQQSNLFNDYETGQISSEHFVNQLLRKLPHHVTPNQVVHAWNVMIQDVPKEVIKLLDHISNDLNKKIYLLSNTNDLHIQHAYQEWHKVSERSPQEIFDYVYLSQEVHMRKPAAEIFEFVCTDQNLDPTTTLFIDDSIQHIESARALGFKTHHLQKQSDIYQLFS